MPEPLSVTCPHCSASFKAKNKAAFGKKVKCPKCDEPFVINDSSVGKARTPQKKKRKPANLKEDFFDDEWETASDPFDDDFDDWDDDLSGGPAVKPTPKKKKKTSPPKKKTRSSFSLKDYGFSPFIAGSFIVLTLLNLVFFFMQSPLLLLVFFLTFLVGFGCLFAGGIGLLIEAAKEGGGELLLCLLIPFYNLYFGISRFEQTKHAVATFVTGVSLMFMAYIFTFGFFSNLRSGRTNFAYTPPAANPAPDFNHNLNTNPNPFTNHNPSKSSSQPRKPENSRSNALTRTISPATQAKPTQLKKYDLSQIEPMLMTWPAEGVSTTFEVYREQSTKSIGKVFEAHNTRSFDDESPAGAEMRFRVYLPPDIDPASPVPCILVPPAGSNLLTGMQIDPHNLIPNPEHEPYVKAGFAVVTFSLDGPLFRREQATNLELKMAHKEFNKSKAGLVNCVHAFLETQAVIPGIDKDNVFIAGHSSAATLSLLFAEHYPQIKGCLAYAPSVDLEKSMAQYIPAFKTVLPDVENFIRLSSPQTHIRDLKCPVFLFHSREDPVTSFQNSSQFASQLKAQGTDVEFVAGNGRDHYQPMIDEGLPKGIEWIKKQIKKTNSTQPAAQMASATGTQKKNASQATPQPTNSLINVTRRKATFKVTGFDEFHTKALKSSPGFWTESLEDKVQMGLKDFVPNYAKGSVKLSLKDMTLSFEFLGPLPKEIPQKIANHFFAKVVTLADSPPEIEEASSDANSRIIDSNYITFRLTGVNRLRFNKKTAPKFLEAKLTQIDRYIPHSLVINYDAKWAFIKLKGLGEKDDIAREADSAFLSAGIYVNIEKIELTPADLAMSGNTTTNPSQPGATTSASTTRQKYVIRYGVYGGKKVKESVKRSLKGFVWVDQKSIQFDLDNKEISFINQSPVDQGALNRALTRNKFYQLNITQEPIPEKESKTKKEEAKSVK